MKFKILTVLVMLFSMTAKTQSLGGSISDSLLAPVPFIPLALLNTKDSSIVKGTNTDDNGSFIFEGIKPGSYLLKIEAVGFKTKFSPAYAIDSLVKLDVGQLILNSAALNLNEVSVTAIKKLVEYKNGNITVNIENSPLAIGNTLYDLLSRLPTITIIDDIISIQGKEGARILINERLQQMSGQQLITLLKSIQASTVEKIEILKNPPVKYDAAGVGFISVKTKKLKITGFSGSVNVDYQQGFYSNKDAGLSLNYKGKDFSVFSSVNTGNDETVYKSFFNKRITYEGVTTSFDQITREKSSSLYASYNMGADWFLNKRNTVGFRIEGSKGESLHKRRGKNNLSDTTLGYNQLVFSSDRPNTWNYVNYNLNAEHQFDSTGTTLRLSADYSPNRDVNRAKLENYFLNTIGSNDQPAKIFKSDNSLKFVIFSGKLDFEKQISKSLKMEAGLKANNQNMTTRFNFNNKDPFTGEYSIDTTFTNGFIYKEQVNAGYLNLSKEYEKFSFQLGLRGENTSIRAASTNSNVSFTRDYFNLFPLVSFNYNPSQKHSYQLSYNRRINRPNYTSFNPYKIFLNLLVIYQGNPYLMPEYMNNFEFTHGYKSSFFNTVSLTVINNIFYGYPIQNDSTKETLQTQSNLTRCYNYSYNTFIQKDLAKWWMVTFNAGISYLTFYGKVQERRYTGSSLQIFSYISNQLTLPASFKLEVTGLYIAPTNVVIYKNKSLWRVEAAIRKSILKNKLTISVGMNDIFYSWVTRNKVNYLNIDSDIRSTNDTQRFKASVTCNFGKVKVQQRQTKSNQEEKKRLDH